MGVEPTSPPWICEHPTVGDGDSDGRLTDPNTVTRDQFMRQVVNPDRCFLCGIEPGSDATWEHVFPKWLLRRHDLWNHRLHLLNGDTVPYRRLTIMCCARCNNEILGRLESEVAAAFLEGADAVRALPSDRLFLWLAKFYYGLLFRELTLLLDRSNPDAGTIVDEEMLRQFSLHNLLLRRLLGTVEWNEFPGTIFVFDALEHSDSSHSFDYFDAFDAPFVCIRSGSVFVVGYLQDFGAVRMLGVEDGPHLAAARTLRLHPLQCGEVMAFFYYILKLRVRVPKFVVIEGDERTYQVVVLPQGGLGGTGPFGPWNSTQYGELLEHFMLMKFGLRVASDASGPPSLLMGSSGNPVQAPDAEWSPDIWDDPHDQA